MLYFLSLDCELRKCTNRRYTFLFFSLIQMGAISEDDDASRKIELIRPAFYTIVCNLVPSHKFRARFRHN